MTQISIEIDHRVVPDWRDEAACSQYPNELFFPLGDVDQRRVERAKAICSICTVSDDCITYALETNQRSGIWGGTTEEERRSLRRKWLAARRRTA